MASTDDLKAKISLDIGIVGGGIGGLAAAIACAKAGLKVTIYEATSTLAEIGAGLTVAPNMTCILRHWKILDGLQQEAVTLQQLSVRRYDDDRELTGMPLTDVEQACGISVLATHRADIQKALKDGAEAAGVQIELQSRVIDIDFLNTRIKVERQSDWLQKDIIIAADGIRSIIRKKMLALHKVEDKIRNTGDAAWRILIAAEQIYGTEDTDLIGMLESPTATRWIGPDAHIICFPIKNHKLLNAAFLHPQKRDTQDLWTTKTDKLEMVEFYKNWNFRVKKLLDCVPDGDILEWKLHDHGRLQNWVENQVVLVGDAAHPMFPYLAQGACQAVEDGAVLAICLASIDRRDQINTALKLFELIRKERAEIVQASSEQMHCTLHLHDGADQRRRDRMMSNAVEGNLNPDLWSNKSFQNWCWGTDSHQQVMEMRNQIGDCIANGKVLQSICKASDVTWLKHEIGFHAVESGKLSSDKED